MEGKYTKDEEESIRNALKHCVFSCTLHAKTEFDKVSCNCADAVLRCHEVYGDKDSRKHIASRDYQADDWNNGIGKRLAGKSEPECQTACEKALANGELAIWDSKTKPDGSPWEDFDKLPDDWKKKWRDEHDPAP